MAIRINFPDKVIAGLHQSYTVTSDEGPPRANLRLGSDELPHRLVPLGPPKEAESTTKVMKYKITFFLPEGPAGKTLGVSLEGGGARVEESKPVVEI